MVPVPLHRRQIGIASQRLAQIVNTTIICELGYLRASDTNEQLEYVLVVVRCEYLHVFVKDQCASHSFPEQISDHFLHVKPAKEWGTKAF